jgi:hypothetical protein
MIPYQEIQNMDPAGYPVMGPGDMQGYGYYFGSDPGDSGSVGAGGGGMSVYYPNGGGGVIIPTGQGAGVIGVGPGQVQNPLMGPVVMPAATAINRPSVSDTVAVGTMWDWFNAPATPMPPVLTPLSLTRPMPAIVQSQPVDVSIPVCDPVSQWVSDNPMWAAGLLAVAALFVFKR